MSEPTHFTTDPSANEHFTALYERAAPKLWAWVAVRLGPTLRTRLDVEDVLQDVACRAWRRFDSFDPALGSFDQWALGIARRALGEVLSRLARGRDARAQWSTASWGKIPDDATRVTARVSRDEHREVVLDWADGLDEDDRRLVLYRGLEQWSHAEVADFLGLNEETARKRWARLVERVRREPRLAALIEGGQGA